MMRDLEAYQSHLPRPLVRLLALDARKANRAPPQLA